MRKKEDDLIQLAFGDLKKEHADILRQSCDGDAEAAATLKSYEMMREGLQGLKDIPEMQMSTERLRDAILKDGLKPHPQSRFNWNLLAWPVSLGLAAAMGWMYLKPTSSTAQPLLVSEESRPVATNFNTNIDLGEPSIDRIPETSGLFGSPNISAMMSKVLAPPTQEIQQTEVGQAKVVERVKSTPKRTRRSNAIVAVKATDESRSSISRMTVASSPATGDVKREETEVAFAAAPKLEAPIVVIEPSPMSTMSTDRAREVMADNVVVGG